MSSDKDAFEQRHEGSRDIRGKSPRLEALAGAEA